MLNNEKLLETFNNNFEQDFKTKEEALNAYYPKHNDSLLTIK